MFTLLVILVWIAIAMIYLLQYQVVRDYRPAKNNMFDRSICGTYSCRFFKLSVFEFPFFRRLQDE